MSYETAGASLLGNRSSNQDCCAVMEHRGSVLLVVADGMGGHPRGADAARIAVEICKRELRAQNTPITDPPAFLARCIDRPHRTVHQFGRRQRPVIDPRTTCVAALVQRGKVWWGHVGDSRCYLFRRGAVLVRTRDHSYVEELHQEGLLLEWEIDQHPRRNIVTRCVGGEPAPPKVTLGREIPLRDGDVLLLCSDGLWSNVEEQGLGDKLAEPAPLGRQINEIAHDAERSGQPQSDNVSVVALRWRDATGAPAAPSAADEARRRGAGTSAVDDDELASAIAEIKRASQNLSREHGPK